MPHTHHECSKIFSGVKKRRSECATAEKSFLADSPERTNPHPTCQRTHAPRRGCAWGRGAWTPAEALKVVTESPLGRPSGVTGQGNGWRVPSALAHAVADELSSFDKLGEVQLQCWSFRGSQANCLAHR